MTVIDVTELKIPSKQQLDILAILWEEGPLGLKELAGKMERKELSIAPQIPRMISGNLIDHDKTTSPHLIKPKFWAKKDGTTVIMYFFKSYEDYHVFHNGDGKNG